MPEAEIVRDFMLRYGQAMVDDSAKAICNNEKERPRFVLQVMQRNYLDQHKHSTEPIERRVVTIQLLNFYNQIKNFILVRTSILQSRTCLDIFSKSQFFAICAGLHHTPTRNLFAKLSDPS